MLFLIFFVLFIVSIIILTEGFGNFNVPELAWGLSILYISLWLIIHISWGICFLGETTPSGQDNKRIYYEELEKNKDNDYLIEDIVEWNQSIQWNQKHQKNFWFGPYIPNIYDQYKTIEIEEKQNGWNNFTWAGTNA